MIEGSGSGRPNNIRILRIRIRNTATMFSFRSMYTGGEWPDGERGITLGQRPHCAAGSPQPGRPSNRTSWVSPSPPFKELYMKKEDLSVVFVPPSNKYFFACNTSFFYFVAPVVHYKSQRLFSFYFFLEVLSLDIERLILDLDLDQREVKNKKENSCKTKWMKRCTWQYTSQVYLKISSTTNCVCLVSYIKIQKEFLYDYDDTNSPNLDVLTRS